MDGSSKLGGGRPRKLGAPRPSAVHITLTTELKGNKGKSEAVLQALREYCFREGDILLDVTQIAQGSALFGGAHYGIRVTGPKEKLEEMQRRLAAVVNSAQ